MEIALELVYKICVFVLINPKECGWSELKIRLRRGGGILYIK
jgi:hypothetical protein